MPYVCSIIDHRRPQNVGKNQKVMHSDVICDLLLNRRTVTCRRFLEYPLMDHFQFLILVNFLFYILLKYGEFLITRGKNMVKRKLLRDHNLGSKLSALKLFSSVMHGDDSVILRERFLIECCKAT